MKSHVLYDGDCAFCRMSISIIRRLDWLGKLDYVNVREGILPVPVTPELNEKLLEQIHLATPSSRIYGGYDAMRAMAWRLPALWPVAPFLYFPGVPWLGDRVYKWIARNRFRIVPCEHGVCSLPNAKSHANR